MKTKRLIASALSVAALATMTAGLAGCAGSGGSKDDTLVWYTFGERPADLDAVLEKANEIIEPKLGVKLDMQYIDSASYQEKMKLKMASSEPYDLAFTGYTNNYQSAVALGGLYDITDLIKEVGLDEVIPQFYFDAATVDGRIYGIPNVQVVSNPVCLHMDKTLADEIDANLDAIQEAAWNAKNLEDIKKYASLLDELFAKIHEARPDLYVLNPTYNLITTPRWEALLGGTYLLKDGSSSELMISLDDNEFAKEAKFGLEKIREWYKNGYIRNDIASAGTSTSSNEEARQIAVRPGTWKPGQDPYCVGIYEDDPVYALLHRPYVGRTSPLATMTSVGANSKNPKKAVEFLKLINEDKELYNIICWGIEGKHYTKDADGFVTEIEGSGYTNIGKNAWKFGNQFNGLLMVGQEPTVWEETEKMNNEAMKSPMLGFVPDTDPVTNELANLANVSAEYGARTNYGTEDPSIYLDEYFKKQEEAGIRKVLAEFQKQYDEFLASKN